MEYQRLAESTLLDQLKRIGIVDFYSPREEKITLQLDTRDFSLTSTNHIVNCKLTLGKNTKTDLVFSGTMLDTGKNPIKIEIYLSINSKFLAKGYYKLDNKRENTLVILNF